MERQKLYLYVVVFAVAVVFTGCGEDEVLTDLQSEVDSLQNEINLLSVKADSVGRENERLQNEIRQLQKEVNALKFADYVDPDEVSQLEERVREVASDAVSNGEDISQLDTKVSAMDNGLNSNTALISQIRGRTDELDSRIGSNESVVSELDTRVSSVIDGGVVTAEEILLVDEDGVVRANLSMVSGDPLMFFYDENAVARIMFGTVLDDPALVMYDWLGETRVDLGMFWGSPYLDFLYADGKSGVSISEWYVRVIGEDETSFVQLESYLESGVVLRLVDEYGNEANVEIVSLNGEATLIFTNTDGEIIASMPLEGIAGAQGSGFLLSQSGLVVTNHHVVESSSDIEVFFPETGIAIGAEVVLSDEANDLSIVRLTDFSLSDVSDSDIPYSIAESGSVNLGEEVFTLGFPLGDVLGESTKLSTGVVNSLYGIEDDPVLFQISNPIQPGNSGSPLFNSEGELIGIVVSSLNARYFYENEDFIPQNVNFAIKSDYLSNLVSMLPEADEIENRENLLAGKSLEEQVEMLAPFMVVVKAQ